MASPRDPPKTSRKSPSQSTDPLPTGAKADVAQARETTERTRSSSKPTAREGENTVAAVRSGATTQSKAPDGARSDPDAREGHTQGARDNAIEDANPKSSRAKVKSSGRSADETLRRGDASPDPAIAGSSQHSADSVADPARRVMPEQIQTRYLQVGDDYHFADGSLAFRDRGRALSTPLENVEVIRDLIAIAQQREWKDIAITGTERFRKEAWQQARLAGLDVRGHTPSELERKQLAYRMGLRAQPNRGPESLDGASPSADAPTIDRADPSVDPLSRPASKEPRTQDRLYRGRLVEHGVARYQFDPRADESYYVLLDTVQGEKYLWGKDLARAVDTSLSRVREDQEVVVRQLRSEPVTVRRPVQDANGRIIEEVQVKSRRNRWSVETPEFLQTRARLAEVVRDVGIDAKTAVVTFPELAGTYADLHVAKLVAENQGYVKERVERFVNRTREAIAQEIEKGEALSPVIDPARYRGRSQSPRTHQRIQERVL